MGWERVEEKNGAQPVLFFTKYEDVTGVKIPEGSKPAPMSMAFCKLLKFVCIGICCDNFCKCCSPCHTVCCCRCVQEPHLKPPPAGVDVHQGVEVEYVGDHDGATKKYLEVWGGNKGVAYPDPPLPEKPLLAAPPRV